MNWFTMFSNKCLVNSDTTSMHKVGPSQNLSIKGGMPSKSFRRTKWSKMQQRLMPSSAHCFGSWHSVPLPLKPEPSIGTAGRLCAGAALEGKYDQVLAGVRKACVDKVLHAEMQSRIAEGHAREAETRSYDAEQRAVDLQANLHDTI